MEEKSVYRQLADCVGAIGSEVVPEIFRSLVDENEAKVLLAASPPATSQELSGKTGIAANDVDKMIEGLFRKGLLFKSKKPDGVKYYRVRHLPQMHDATAVMQDPPEGMLDLWKKYMAAEWNDFIKIFEKNLPQAFLRVIPVNISVGSEARVLAFDDVKSIVEKSKSLAVTKCSCRAIDGKCGKDIDVCLQIDKAADYSMERGTGIKLSKSEAIAMLKKCEEDGLVHLSDNRRASGHVICNCCSDCCMMWPSIRVGEGKFVAPSRFGAVVDAEACSGCGDCLDRCYFDALSMNDVKNIAEVDAEKCMGCGLCTVTCAEKAVSLVEVRPEEFVPA